MSKVNFFRWKCVKFGLVYLSILYLFHNKELIYQSKWFLVWLSERHWSHKNVKRKGMFRFHSVHLKQLLKWKSPFSLPLSELRGIFSGLANKLNTKMTGLKLSNGVLIWLIQIKKEQYAHDIFASCKDLLIIKQIYQSMLKHNLSQKS